MTLTLIKNSTILSLIAGSALALTTASFLNRRYNTIAKAKNVVKEIEELDEDEIITEEDIINIFNSLFIQMQQVLSQIGQQIQQLQMMGQSIPEAQLKQLLRGEFERSVVNKQAKVFDDFDVDEDCVEEATMEFLSEPEKYPKVKQAVERFQTLWENVSGEEVVKKNPSNSSSNMKTDLTKEELLTASKLFFEALTSSMNDIIQKLKDSGANLSDPSVIAQMQMEFASSSQEKGEQELEEKMGISLHGFREAIDKYQNDPEVGQALAMLQIKQQKDLMAMGVSAI